MKTFAGIELPNKTQGFKYLTELLSRWPDNVRITGQDEAFIRAIAPFNTSYGAKTLGRTVDRFVVRPPVEVYRKSRSVHLVFDDGEIIDISIRKAIEAAFAS